MSGNLSLALRIDARLGQQFDQTFNRARRDLTQLGAAARELGGRQVDLARRLAQAGLSSSQALSRMRHDYHALGQQIDRVTAAQQRFERAQRFSGRVSERLGAARGELGASMVAGGAAVLAGAGVMRAYMEQENAATDLKIAMMDKNGAVGAFRALNAQVIDLGNQLPGTTTDFYNLAQALKEQGLSDQKLLNGGLRTSAYLNILLNMDQRSGGEFFAKLLEAHGLGEKDFAAGADLVQRAKFAFGLSKENMFESMKYYSPAVNTLRLTGLGNTEKLMALQGMGAQVGKEGSSWGTNFSMFLNQLAEGPEKIKIAKKGMKGEVRDMLEAAHVSFDFWDKKGNFLGLDHMVKKLGKLDRVRARYGDKGVSEVVHQLFGTEAGQVAQILYQKGWKGYQGNIGLMRGQANMDQRIAAKSATLGNAWESMTGTAKNFVASIGEQFAPELRTLFKEVNDWIGGPMTRWVAAHKFVTTAARGRARLGAMGYHPSLLPRHRGRDAVEWALRMGDVITGGTVYWLDDGADTGPIAAQDWCWIRPGMKVQELWRQELAPMGLRLLGQVLRDLMAGRRAMKLQDETMATWEPAVRGKRLKLQ